MIVVAKFELSILHDSDILEPKCIVYILTWPTAKLKVIFCSPTLLPYLNQFTVNW